MRVPWQASRYVSLGSPICTTTSRWTRHFSNIGYLKEQGGRRSTYSKDEEDRDLILSVLKAVPSKRDTKTYIDSFKGKHPPNGQSEKGTPKRSVAGKEEIAPSSDAAVLGQKREHTTAPQSQHDLNIMADFVQGTGLNRTALVKLQGPFSDDEVSQIAKGVRHLGRLGLSCILMVDSTAILSEEAEYLESEQRLFQRKNRIIGEITRVTNIFEQKGIPLRPITYDIFNAVHRDDRITDVRADISPIISAIGSGQIPILGPLAVDQDLRVLEVGTDQGMLALVRSMMKFDLAGQDKSVPSNDSSDLIVSQWTPHRIMLVNQEGGVPSVARGGLPHLNINLATEYDPIVKTFDEHWKTAFPSSLSNLKLLKSCLDELPRSSSGCIVSHRSPQSLVANLITNKPVVSSSLPYRALTDARNLGGVNTPAHMPTLVRAGTNMTALSHFEDLDQSKLEFLLERSFKKKLKKGYWEKLRSNLIVAIIAGDYEGAALLTREGIDAPGGPITYLDKFAVLPGRQGDGVADFLWGEILDRCMATDPAEIASLDGLSWTEVEKGPGRRLGQYDRLVHESGYGSGLIWRSRTTNPVNRWYFERADGHVRLYQDDRLESQWTFFWVGGSGTGRNIGKIDPPRFNACKRVVEGIEASFL